MRLSKPIIFYILSAVFSASPGFTVHVKAEEISAPVGNLGVSHLVKLLQDPVINWDDRKRLGRELSSRPHREVLPAIHQVLRLLPFKGLIYYGNDPYDHGQELSSHEQIRAVLWRTWTEQLANQRNSRDIGLTLLEILRKNEGKTELESLLRGLEAHWVNEATDDVVGILKDSSPGQKDHLRLLAAHTLVTGTGNKANPIVIEVARKASRKRMQPYLEAMMTPTRNRGRVQELDPRLVEFGFESLQMIVLEEGIASYQANSMAHVLQGYISVTFAPEEKKRLSGLPYAHANDIYFAKLAENALAWWKINANSYKT
jgi:hypothetical protein